MWDRLNHFLRLCFLAAIIGLASAIAMAAPTACDLSRAASLGGCDSVYFGWFTRRTDVVSQVIRYSDGFSPAIAPSARSYTRTNVGCQYSTRVTVTQVYANGEMCAVTESDNHNRPCDQCAGVTGSVSVVSSANFRGALARGALASVFSAPNTVFTDRAMSATALPLPVTLAGVTVEINGTNCSLLAVTPNQINFQIPATLPEGPTEASLIVSSLRGSSSRFVGYAQINPNAPGIFTRTANGTGAAAAVWLSGVDVDYLLLFGTGINEPNCELVLGNGRRYIAQYCGLVSGLIGLQQMNFTIPHTERWPDVVSGFVRVNKPNVGYWDSQGFEIR